MPSRVVPSEKWRLKQAAQRRVVGDMEQKINWWRSWCKSPDTNTDIIKINPLEEVKKCGKK